MVIFQLSLFFLKSLFQTYPQLHHLFLNFQYTLLSRTDIEHNYLRPWMIAIGRDGLVNGIYRGSITVTQQSNNGGPHKGYQFSHVFPTNCEGFTVNYGSQDFLAKTVTFACRDYRLI